MNVEPNFRAGMRPFSQTKSRFAVFLFSLLLLAVSSFDALAQSRVIVGYFQNWNNASAPYIRLRDVNPKYNVIDVAFATPVAAGDMTMTFTPTMQTKTEFIADMRTLQSQGRKVLISIGGADAPVELNTTADRDKFVTTMKALITDYGFDGFDIDLEGTSVILNSGDTNFKSSTTPKITNLITAARDITTYFRGLGKDFWLTSAPEVQYVQGGYGNYGTAYGGYLPILYGIRDILTFVHVQYYNTGSQNALDDKIYSQGTADFIVSMTDMLLKGFPVARNTANMFPALRQDQVAFGLPATGTGAAPAGGYVTPADVTKALNYLVKGTSYGGGYALTSTYPNLRGIMTWSINWDKSQGDAFVNNAYSFFSTLGGTTNTAPTVSLTSPANGATFTAPASITISANAADSDGTISKVDFYNGATLLNSDTSAPYSYSWTGIAAGTYSITAKATDNAGAVTTSGAVSVTVSTAQTGQAIPGTIEAESFSAQFGTQNETTTDTGGGLNVGYIEAADYLDYAVNVATAGSYTVGFRVASLNGGATLQLRNSAGSVLGSVNVGATGGWQTWQTLTTTATLPAGAQTLRVYAAAGGVNINWLSFTGTSTNTPPTVSLTSPANGATATAPATITISANAADANGTVSSVAFYNGATLLNTDTTAPYSYSWTGVAAGTYSLTAKATDNQGAVTTSAAVSVSVSTTPANTPPTVSLTSPANGATAVAPASITISANAADANGSVSSVAFYQGATLLNTDTTAPYSYTWTGVAAGTYSITAKATDNQGAVTTSAAVSITVTGSGGTPCSSAPTWVAATAYVAGNNVSYAGNLYTAKWWSQGENPATYSCTDCSWRLVGPCTGARGALASSSAASAQLSVYPNPIGAGKQLTVDLGATYAKVQLVITDLSGRRLASYSYQNVRAAQLSLPSLPNGVLLLQIKTGTESFTRKLLNN